MPKTGTMPKVAERLLRLLDTLLVWIATTAFAVMMLAVIGQVVFRYLLETAVPWTEELARLLFVESMLVGMAIAIRRHEHIVVDFLLNKLAPERRRLAVAAFELVTLFLLALLMRGSWDLVLRNWNARLVSLPWVSVGYVYLGLFVSLGLMIFYTLLNMAKRLTGAAEPAGTGLERDA